MPDTPKVVGDEAVEIDGKSCRCLTWYKNKGSEADFQWGKKKT